MADVNMYRTQIEDTGFVTINNVFSEGEVEKILLLINQTDTSRKTFRKSVDLFAIRQFLKEVPEIGKLILNDEFKLLIHDLFGSDYFIVKSIYFDKPEQSNWFVSYHQDLTISVDRRGELDDYRVNAPIHRYLLPCLAEENANAETSGLCYHKHFGIVVKRDSWLDEMMKHNGLNS